MNIHSNNLLNRTSEIIYDFVLVGLGASNSLILLSLLKNGLLATKKVAIIETENKNVNDKTYCFWAKSTDNIVIDLSAIISHRYQSIIVDNSLIQNIIEQPYHYIQSIDLYNYTLNACTNANIPIFRETVGDITPQNDLYIINTATQKFTTQYIFDSRPPSKNKLNDNDIYLHQSFHGFHIKCEKAVFTEHNFEMMNFDVDQHQFTQFLYTLPFSPTEALVELTRFGADKIDIDYSKQILNESIGTNYGNYEIIAEETGCIPMTTYTNPPNKNKGILQTGASANLIKPSTGYGFKKMFEFAEQVSQQLVKGNYQHFNKITVESKQRFKFYDRLLLTILLLWPNQGKRIFTQLFNNQNIHTIYLFLDEKTSILQEIRIFATLPIIPFLKALIGNLKKWPRYCISLLFIILYFIIAQYNSTAALYVSYIGMAIGLLVVGIPHGALDHLLQRDKQFSLPVFITKYLLIIIVYFGCWILFPLFSLILFILYSSFHFGESELNETGMSVHSIPSYLKAFLVGLSILAFIIFSHFYESISVIASIKGLNNIHTYANEWSSYATYAAGVAFSYILIQLITTKKWMYLGLLALMIIGVQLPLAIAFALYFITQHSTNAWGHLKAGLKVNSIALYKQALPYTLGALLVLLGIIISPAASIFNEEGLLAYFFIFLACISLPHFLLMHRFYKSKISR